MLKYEQICKFLIDSPRNKMLKVKYRIQYKYAFTVNVYNCLKAIGQRVLWEGYVVQGPTQVKADWMHRYGHLSKQSLL